MLRRTQRLTAGVLLTAITCLPAITFAQAATNSSATKPATTTAASQPVESVNAALGERIAYGMAQGLLRARPIVQATWPATVALLEGAMRCAPDEPRIQRMLVEALLREGSSQRALEVLLKYRLTNEGKDDHGAQTQTIDLYLTQLDTVDKQIAYLRDVVGRNSIPDPVRSYSALRCAELLAEHMQDEESLKMVDQALRLNPLNLRALRIRYQTLKNGTPTERLAAMLAMLKSNPAQPALLLAVAQDLADAGLLQPALQWYNVALSLYPRTELRTPGRETVVDFACLIFMSGDAKTADGIVTRITTAEPDSINAWLLRLIIARSANDKEGLGVISRQAGIALTNRLAMLRRAAGDATATTRPVEPTGEVPSVDVPANLAALQRANNPDLVEQFGVVAQTMAWIKIYFEEKPADAEPWINALSRIVPQNDPTVARLQGWQMLRANNVAGARAKLSAMATQDPLAAAGLVLAADNTPQAQDKAGIEGRGILSSNPSGLTGAQLVEMLAPKGIRLVPGPIADQLSAELAKFPRDWLGILEQPQNFYTLRLDPVRFALQPGDPLLLRVVIMNNSDFDLTIGPEGILHNDLWMDAQLRGANQDTFGSEAFDRITKRLVLPAKQTMSQTVRLDTAQLPLALLGNPQKFFQISAACMTNPIMIGGQITTGPGGYRAVLPKERMMERQAAPFNSPQVVQRVDANVTNGEPAQKVQALELLATFYNALMTIEDPKAKELAGHFAEEIRRGTTETDPTVRAWALYVLSFLAGERDLPVIVRTMVQDPNWQTRMLSIVLIELRGAPRQLIKPLEQDPDPLVKKLAIAIGKMPVVRPPATQPAPGAAPTGGSPAPSPAPAGPGVSQGGAAAPVAPGPAAIPTGAPPSGAAPTGGAPASGGPRIMTTPPPPASGPTLP
ncbi:MAG TPA: hypothetical protein VF669_11235 [Tepidisphaeraceae bacterium]|jgi:tetratricopeptide (TPR) repeat protein